MPPAIRFPRLSLSAVISRAVGVTLLCTLAYIDFVEGTNGKVTFGAFLLLSQVKYETTTIIKRKFMTSGSK